MNAIRTFNMQKKGKKKKLTGIYKAKQSMKTKGGGYSCV